MRRRPAETVGATAGLGGLVAAVATGNGLAAAVACAGLLPAAVTFVVAHGGVRGTVGLFWRGRDREVTQIESTKRRSG
jgi:hypothetical protein